MTLIALRLRIPAPLFEELRQVAHDRGPGWSMNKEATGILAAALLATPSEEVPS